MFSMNSNIVVAFLFIVFLQTLITECEGETCAPICLSNGTVGYMGSRQSGRWNSGTVASFSCSSRFTKSQSTSRTCLDSGTWNDQTLSCTITCPHLTSPCDGGVTYNRQGQPPSTNGDWVIGTVASFYCNTNYIRRGPSTRTCQNSGNWNSQNPTCSRIVCPCLSISNGVVDYNKNAVNGGRPVGTVASFSCNSGYSLSVSSSRTCQNSGNWNNALPTCNQNPPPKKSCFPLIGKVRIENGKSVQISELQIGNKVQAVSSTGDVIFSEVKAFLHEDDQMTGMYKLIKTLANESITLSGNHLIFTRKLFSSEFNTIYADHVSVDDEVLVKGYNKLIPTKVMNTFDVMLQGAYTPLTAEGNIIVDGVLASCYPSADHDVAHIGMAPLRWFPGIVQCIFGTEYGFPAFVRTSEKLATWLHL